MAKQITQDERLKLLGLFTLATNYYRLSREAEFAMNRALGKDANNQGHLSDAIYQDAHRVEDFDEALKNEGFEVAE
jgi:hypothetical protein